MVLESFGHHAMQLLSLLEIQDQSFGVQPYRSPRRPVWVYRRYRTEVSDVVDGVRNPSMPVARLARHDMRQMPS